MPRNQRTTIDIVPNLHRCGPSCGCKRRGLSSLDASVAAAFKPVGRSLDRLSESLDGLPEKIRDARARRAAVRDAQHDVGGIVSATSGYIRDANGARLRPMNTADLARMHRDHYRRADSAAAEKALDALPANSRPETTAGLQACTTHSTGADNRWASWRCSITPAALSLRHPLSAQGARIFREAARRRGAQIRRRAAYLHRMRASP